MRDWPEKVYVGDFSDSKRLELWHRCFRRRRRAVFRRPNGDLYREL